MSVALTRVGDDSPGPVMLAPALTPTSVLMVRPAEDAPRLTTEQASRLTKAFARGTGHGLLCIGADEVGSTLPPLWAFWREFATRYVTTLCALPDLGERSGKSPVPLPSDDDLDRTVAAVPPMVGAEYLKREVLSDFWRAMDAAFDVELGEAKLSIQAFLKRRHPAWNLVGRVHFNLAENRNDEAAPFAFLATYTTRLSADARAQHLPLGKALREYGGAGKRDRLLSLLMPVQRAGEQCPWLKAMVDAGEIFQPLGWTPAQALQFLKDIPALESAGIIVRMPANWRMNRPARPQVTATIGAKTPSRLGMDALLDFEMEVTLEGESLSAAEIRRLLAQTDSLVMVRGKWVEIDRERLQRTMAQFEAVERRAASDGLSFAEAMRLLAGVGSTSDAMSASADVDWGKTVAGPWLAGALRALRDPDRLSRIDPVPSLHGTLRGYQQVGVQWLHLLVQLKLGACLADDMGLGKTIQILSLLLVHKNAAPAGRKPCLIVAPASVLANWAGEIARFAPSLRAAVVHPSAMPAEAAKTGRAVKLSELDLVITSYGFLARAPWLMANAWCLVIIDEAQAIKNPSARQTQLVKKLQADSRIALTGTPIENRLGDLWSIFDFLNPGLLGSSKQFSSFVKHLTERSDRAFAPLRDLTRPYILRRLKTDKSIIADLPDKTEVKTFCSLSRKQAALYQQSVRDLRSQLEAAEGMQRKGIVLAFLMRLKQICNHPSQWLGDGDWAEEDSGKLIRLREIAETLATRQEKALVFSQFREITAPLATYLGSVFGRPGLVLHGATEVGKRKDLVRRFQEDEDIPFFVLSLKAGGAGLNLTAASHVIHFDRWWNPAVENQATDRAFRIGQTRNVLVHKFICRGTVEDKIDQLIGSKHQLAGDFLSGGADMLLTEMRDEELLKLVTLDLNAAMAQG